MLVSLLVVACEKQPTPPTGETKPQPAQPAQPAKAPAAEKEHRGGQHENDTEREQQAVETPLDITVNGKPAEAWSMEKLQKVKMRPSADGKEMWSLRDLAHELVSPKARVSAVRSGEYKTAIDQADWDDPNRTPQLRVNRQGQFKLEWSGVKSAKAGFKGEIRDIDGFDLVE